MIQVILLDVDDTLLDFNLCAKTAMQEAFGQFRLCFEERMFPVFQRINGIMWREIEQGRLTRAELHETRWNRIFRELGIVEDGPAFEQCFCDRLCESHVAVPGALELLEQLSGQGYVLCAASNAPYAQQVRRLECAGMRRYLSHLFVSERIGASKPSQAFFAHCLAAFPTVLREDILIIGDSLTADIRGGQDCGIQTCWYNPGHVACDPALRPTLETDDLRRIPALLRETGF